MNNKEIFEKRNEILDRIENIAMSNYYSNDYGKNS